MATTFAPQGLIIGYHRPAEWPADPTGAFQQLAADLPGGHFAELNGTTPAVVMTQNSDSTGANFGDVIFVVNGTEVRVMGHMDDTALEAIAQSILRRWPSDPSQTSSQCPGPIGSVGPTGATGPKG